VKKIECGFAVNPVNSDTIIYDFESNRFFSYRKDKTFLVNRFNGNDYTDPSKKDRHGAGEIFPESGVHQFGFYTSKGFWNMESIMVGVTLDGKPIYGYVPITYHGIDTKKPVILTDKKRVVFSNHDEVYQNINNWYVHSYKSCHYRYFSFMGRQRTLTYFLANSNKFLGVNAFNFIDYEYATTEIMSLKEISPCFKYYLKIFQTSNWEGFYHLNHFSILDKKFSNDPRNTQGQLSEGWFSEGNGLFWRKSKNDNTIQAFMEIKKTPGGKWCSSEETILESRWDAETKQYWLKYFTKKLKIRK
jgi:hypothetical protein